MNVAIQIQTVDKAVCILYGVNVFWNCMEPTMLFSAKSKYLGSLTFLIFFFFFLATGPAVRENSEFKPVTLP